MSPKLASQGLNYTDRSLSPGVSLQRNRLNFADAGLAPAKQPVSSSIQNFSVFNIIRIVARLFLFEAFENACENKDDGCHEGSKHAIEPTSRHATQVGPNTQYDGKKRSHGLSPMNTMSTINGL